MKNIKENPLWTMSMSRRTFLKAAGAAGVSLFGGGIAGCEIPRPPMPPPHSTPEAPQVTIVEQIRLVEAQAEGRRLTFPEAKVYVPLVGQLFVQATNSSKKAGDLTAKVYIVHIPSPEDVQAGVKNPTPDSNPSPGRINPLYNQLKFDYPDIALSQESIDALPGGALMNVGWVDDEGNIFLSLLHLNNNTQDKGLDPILQYRGDGQFVTCEKPNPLVKLRSVLMHELVHKETEREWRPLEPEVFESYTRVLKTAPALVAPPLKQNFMIKFSYRPRGSTQEIKHVVNEFNEFNTDYIHAFISIMYDLPFTLRYGSPADIRNFRIVLNQAGVDIRTFHEWYRKGQIKEFLLAVAQAAENVSFSSQEEMLDFGMRHFSLWNWSPHWGNKRAISAPSMQLYYPGVDNELYRYTNTSVAEGEDEDRVEACIIR